MAVAHHDPAEAVAPRVVARDLPVERADVARHVALAGEALRRAQDAATPTDADDALVAEDQDEDPRRSALVQTTRSFRTRAPAFAVPEQPAAAGLLRLLEDFDERLGATHERARRVSGALDAVAAALGAAPAATDAGVARAAAGHPGRRVDDDELDRVRRVAIEMAVSGFPRGTVASLLADEHGVLDAGRLLDDVYGPGTGESDSI